MNVEVNNMIGKYILLTGAGFTHNFGTPLADEMWSAIFNDEQIQAEHKIKSLLKSNCCDYEKIYDIIMNGSYTEKERGAFDNALYSAYKDIDSTIINFIKTRSSTHNIRQLISLFSDENRKTFFFTLNQDLFIERFYSYNYRKIWMKPIIPGIKNKSNWFSKKFENLLEPSDYCKVPNEVELNNDPDSLDGNFFYVKLHGSCNWIDSNSERLILTGNRKAEEIKNESLLKYYCKLFKSVLSQPEQRLLIIGYGFGDKHINEIIANAVKKHKLKLFIISPNPPDKFHKDLLSKEYGNDIWQGMTGYCPYKLTDLLTNIGPHDRQYSKIINTFFEKNILR